LYCLFTVGTSEREKQRPQENTRRIEPPKRKKRKAAFAGGRVRLTLVLERSLPAPAQVGCVVGACLVLGALGAAAEGEREGHAVVSRVLRHAHGTDRWRAVQGLEDDELKIAESRAYRPDESCWRIAACMGLPLYTHKREESTPHGGAHVGGSASSARLKGQTRSRAEPSGVLLVRGWGKVKETE
jgi:hypothetical protein